MAVLIMHLLTLITVISAALHIASALPSSTSFTFFSYVGLPGCAKTCANLHGAAINCVPPTAPVSFIATYVACFCQSQWLDGANEANSICPQECDEKDEASILSTYKALCGLPGPSATLFLSIPAPTTSPTDRSIPASSTLSALTTSTTTILATQIATQTVEIPHDQPEQHESWIHKHLATIIVAILTVFLVMLLVVAWLIYCRYTQTRVPLPPVPERYPSDDELFLRDHQRLFDYCQQRKPIYIVDNSRQARFWRWLKREKICPPQGQEVFELQEMNEALQERHGIEYNLKNNKFIISSGSRFPNRRPRSTLDSWIRINGSFSHPSPVHRPQGLNTPGRPSSSPSRTNREGQHLVSSPLRNEFQPLGPRLPVWSNTPRTPHTPIQRPLLTQQSPLASLRSRGLPLSAPDSGGRK